MISEKDECLDIMYHILARKDILSAIEMDIQISESRLNFLNDLCIVYQKHKPEFYNKAIKMSRGQLEYCIRCKSINAWDDRLIELLEHIKDAGKYLIQVKQGTFQPLTPELTSDLILKVSIINYKKFINLSKLDEE